MGHGDIAIQPGQMFGLYGTRGRSQQDVHGYPLKIDVLLIVTGRSRNQLPEGILRAVFHQRLIQIVALQIQSGLQHRPDDGTRQRLLDADDGAHDGQVQIPWMADGRHGRYLCPAILGVKELLIMPDELPVRLAFKQVHLRHPLRDEIGAVRRPGVKLDIQKPVVLQLLISDGAVNHIVAVGVIVRQQLFD